MYIYIYIYLIQVSILVDGYSTAEYSLIVTLKDITVQLIDGKPQHSSVAEV
jgi:hypothetical protein